MADSPTPDRVIIGNVETGESFAAIFNPTEVKRKLGIDYERSPVPGLSHKPLHFVGTGNNVIDLEFGFDVLSAPDGVETTAFSMRSFIESLGYQQKSSSSIATGAPPRVLLMWPNLYEMVVKLINLEETDSEFAPDMSVTLFVMKITFEEDRKKRLFSEDVRRAGTLRSGQ